MPSSQKIPVISVKGLSVTRNIPILKKIDWTALQGENWVILGANGSGKTCLLSVLTGYLEFTSGEVEVLGKRYGESDWRELRKEVGLVSSAIRQRMDDHEPVLESVVSGRYAMIDYRDRIRPGDRKEALQILRQIECRHLVDRPWRVLSQGERQRVLIGRALMARYRILILDEPCSGLDPVAREHFLNFVQRLGSDPQAPMLILVTHHVEEIVPMISHVLVLKAGRVLRQGLRKDVLKNSVLNVAFQTRVRLFKKGNKLHLHIPNRGKGIL